MTASGAFERELERDSGALAGAAAMLVEAHFPLTAARHLLADVGLDPDFVWNCCTDDTVHRIETAVRVVA